MHWVRVRVRVRVRPGVGAGAGETGCAGCGQVRRVRLRVRVWAWVGAAGGQADEGLKKVQLQGQQLLLLSCRVRARPHEWGVGKHKPRAPETEISSSPKP